mgnify:CR=1 FL=1
MPANPAPTKSNTAAKINLKVFLESLRAASSLLISGVIKKFESEPKKNIIFPASERSAYCPAKVGERKCFASNISTLIKIATEIPFKSDAE